MSGHWIAFDEPRIPRRAVIAKSWAPEIFVALAFQDRDDALPRGGKTGDTDQHVDDRFRRKTGNRRTTEVFNAFEQLVRETVQKVLPFELKLHRPAWIVRFNGDLFAEHSLDTLLKCFHVMFANGRHV